MKPSSRKAYSYEPALSVPSFRNSRFIGGVIVLAIGLNLLKLTKTKTIDMLPALVLIVLYGLWAG